MKSALTLALLVAVSLFAEFRAASAQGGGAKVGSVDHVALTVGNVDASESFFGRQLGFEVLKRDTGHPAVYMTNGHIVVVLYRLEDLGAGVAFDRKRNVGLHHLAFTIGSFEELDSMHARLVRIPGVVVEFAPELLGNGPAKHMIIREPGGNRIEFIHRPPA